MSERLSSLADIIGPVAPQGSTGQAHWVLVAAAAAALLGLGLLVWWVRTAEPRRARRRLRDVRRAYRDGRLSERDMAYRVAGEMARVLGVTRVAADTPPPRLAPADNARWAQLVNRLDALRYRPPAPADSEDLENLLAWVQSRVGRWR